MAQRQIGARSSALGLRTGGSEGISQGQISTRLGNRGGEFLSSLGRLPVRTYATEGYPPNGAIARDTLKPLGVDVVRTYAEDNTKRPQLGALPVRTESLDMIIDRHESFVASEVYRVLKRGDFLDTTGRVC